MLFVKKKKLDPNAGLSRNFKEDLFTHPVTWVWGCRDGSISNYHSLLSVRHTNMDTTHPVYSCFTIPFTLLYSLSVIKDFGRSCVPSSFPTSQAASFSVFVRPKLELECLTTGLVDKRARHCTIMTISRIFQYGSS